MKKIQQRSEKNHSDIHYNKPAFSELRSVDKSTAPKKILKHELINALNPILFAVGICVISVDISAAPLLLNICMKEKYSYRSLEAYDVAYDDLYNDDSTRSCRRIIMCVTAAVYRKICLNWASEKGNMGSLPILEKCIGVPFLLMKYRHRYGAFIGLILMCIILYLGCGYVWDIRVLGNDNLSDMQVIRQLEEKGLKPGIKISSLDVDGIENNLLLSSDDISWITINIRGTVAHVQIREKQEEPEKKEILPANLIASKKGEIVLLEIYSGKAMVEIGNIVNEGDLLVSGIYDSKSVGFRIRRASGKIYARTKCTLTVEIPFEYTEKVYTGNVFEDKNLIFFSNNIKISKNSRNLPVLCDRIDIVDIMTLVRGKNLPVIIEKTQYLEYKLVKAQRNAEEATLLAFRELDYQLALIGINASFLKKTTVSEITDDSVILNCEIVLLENIAKVSEFEVNNGIIPDPAA